MKVLTLEERPIDQPELIYQDKSLDGRPALHALIAGVSDYAYLPAVGLPETPPSLGMRPLSSTSLTAYLIVDWLLQAAEEGRLEQPLGTVRLLLSPTPAEVAKTMAPSAETTFRLPPMDRLQVPRCDLFRFRAAADKWRKSGRVNRQGATFFYFSGHGIQRNRSDQLLLLDSFGAGGPLGQHAVDTSSLTQGMAPHSNDPNFPNPETARPDIARTQFYFVDACRSVPRQTITYEQMRASAVFDVESPNMPDDRRAPVFYASIPHGTAQAIPGKQTLFSMALLRCLKGEAAQAPDVTATGRRSDHWHVSSFSLMQGLSLRLDEVRTKYGAKQIGIFDGLSDDAVLCYLKDRPAVPFQFIVEPEAALGFTRVLASDVSDPANSYEFHAPRDRHPFRPQLKAGYYQFSAALDTPTPPFRDCAAESYLIEPLRRQRIWTARMTDGA